MRDLMSKLMTGSMIAGAALFVTACGGGESANNTEMTNVTEMNSTEPLEGTTNDVTAVDGAAGVDANMAGSNMSTDSMSGGMSGGAMGDNMTTNSL